MDYSIFELFKILDTTASSVTKSSLIKSFLVFRARTLLSFETKFNILFVKINIRILNNSFIIHELVNLAIEIHYIYFFENWLMEIPKYETNIQREKEMILFRVIISEMV